MQKSSPRSVTAFTALVLLSACPTGNWGNPARGQANLVPCSESFAVFSPSGAAATYSFIDQLPEGKYTRSNIEIYVHNSVPVPGTRPEDRRSNETKVQFQEIYTGAEDAETAELDLRCLETVNTFIPHSLSNVTIPTRMIHYKNGNFEANSRRMNLSVISQSNAQAVVTDGGRTPPTHPSQFARDLGVYWNSGVTWLRRSGEVFEFQGTRFDGTRYVYGKATFLRKDLPANSP